MATEDGKKTGGRQAGTQNKFTGTMKDTFLEVFEELGGKAGFVAWVKESKANKRFFYSQLGKMIPREVYVANGDSPDSLPFKLLIESEKSE